MRLLNSINNTPISECCDDRMNLSNLVGTSPYHGALPIALAPDDCTIYYGEYASSSGRFNACTNTQISSEPGAFPAIDDLLVLPNWQVIIASDHSAQLWSEDLMTKVRNYDVPAQLDNGPQSLRSLTPDTDDTSFWACCAPIYTPAGDGPYQIVQFDIASGEPLTYRSPVDFGTFYSPPLLGNADVESTVDSDSPGTAEAFVARVGYSGQMSRLHVYVDSPPRQARSSSASTLTVTTIRARCWSRRPSRT